MRIALGLLAITLAGCNLYFGSDDDDDPCKDIAYGGVAPSLPELRNPETGQCESRPYPYPCDGVCGPCPAAETTGEPAQKDWGSCFSTCEGLDESSCQATAGCFAAYLSDPAVDVASEFWGCWQTAPSGPVHGMCSGLDAQECSRHDDCVAYYEGSWHGAASFGWCAPEPTAACLSDSECGAGSHCDTVNFCDAPPGCDDDCPTCGACPPVCYGRCVPDYASCALVDCAPGYHCQEQCTGDPNSNTMTTCTPVCVQDSSCLAADCAPGTTCVERCTLDTNGQWVCGIECVPDPNGDPGSCYGNVICAMAAPACPMGTTPGVTNGCYTGYCIPVADCGPNDPGTCTGDVICAAVAPACPSGTVPGISGGCWSGYCIPSHDCPDVTCDELTTESACTARTDCLPVYEGTNCTCSPNGCTCQTLAFDRCESAYMPF